MASLFRVLVSRPYVSVLRRSFALAAAKPVPDATTSSNDEAPLFETLRGVIDNNTLEAIKHTHMSPVQAQIFPLLPNLVSPYDPNDPTSERKDLLVKAKTGTGKTMGFLIPAIEARIKAINAHLDSTADSAEILDTPQLRVRAINQFAIERVGTLIVSPTRELATQIAVEASNLTKNHVGFQVRVLLGGESKGRQLREWAGRKDIVVCTPGRVLDLLNSVPRFSEPFKHTQMLILDEADTLLELGFRDDIEFIKTFLPPSPQRQTLLFSATVSSAIRQVAISTMSRSYKFINCVPENDTPVHEHIPQYHTVVEDPSQIFSYLLQMITHDQLVTGGKSKIIIFFSTTKAVQLFSNLIIQVAHQVLPSGRKTKLYEMHAKRTMESRMSISRSFRNDTSGSSILVTTDVSARGVDYPGVSRVIQMGVPATGDMYTHRVGRTGRGDNKTGRGDLILCSWEMGFLKKQLSKIPLKPLIMSDMLQQTKELAESKDAEIDGPDKTPDCSSRLSEIEPLSRTILGNVGKETADEIFMSQIGFYSARSHEMGFSKEEALEGLQNWTKELFALETAPYLSLAMQQRLGLLSDNPSNRRTTSSRSSSSWEGRGYQSSRQPWEGRGQSSRQPWTERGSQSSRPPWEGRGNQSSRSWEGRGNRPDKANYGFGERPSGFGTSPFSSRDSKKDSSTPRSSRYGSRDDKDKPTYRAPRFINSRDFSKKDEYNTPGSSSGSRDYVNPGAARYGSSRFSNHRS